MKNMKITINVTDGAPASFDFKEGNPWNQLTREEQLLALRTFAAAHETFLKFLKPEEDGKE